ncbi:MAG: hypothetical protein R3C49_08255 [Planctomycetaceae bacterium]
MFNRVQGKSLSQNDLSFLVPNSQINAMPLELQELCEQYNLECQNAEDQDPAMTSDWPVSLFVPERYEERYAYPLLIWFHDENSSENELNPVMQAIGDQNYCGLALRGNTVLEGHDSFGWNIRGLNFGRVPLKRLVNLTTRRLRKAFHIHSERIFAAGSGSGADVALQLFSEAPEWFAGAVLIDPPCEARLTLGHPADLRGKHILQTVSRSQSNETLARNLDAVRLLRSTGVEVDVRVTEEPLDPCSNHVRFIDSWILSRLNCETYV